MKEQTLTQTMNYTTASPNTLTDRQTDKCMLGTGACIQLCTGISHIHFLMSGLVSQQVSAAIRAGIAFSSYKNHHQINQHTRQFFHASTDCNWYSINQIPVLTSSAFFFCGDATRIGLKTSVFEVLNHTDTLGRTPLHE